MNAYEAAKIEQQHLIENALLVAYAVVAIQGHKDDELSANEAYHLYGHTWVKDRTKRGMLHTLRSGAEIKSTKIYSRFEIEALKRAEKHVSEAFDAAQRRVEELQTTINN